MTNRLVAMSTLSLETMRAFLGRSIASGNANKLRGLLAEIELRNYLGSLGFTQRISPGGWIARCDGQNTFGHHTVVMFPELIEPDIPYPIGRNLSNPHGLHTICSTFHQSRIRAYFCAPTVSTANDALSIEWQCVQLGLPFQQDYDSFPISIDGFRQRPRRHNFLRYSTDASLSPEAAVPEEFTKEHLRVAFQSMYFSELSPLHGLFWGNRFTCPLEISEQPSANDRHLGTYFELDIGSFVKFAVITPERRNLNALFIVREIDSPDTRRLSAWWFMTFDRLARFAPSVPRGRRDGRGKSGAHTVIKIPQVEFEPLSMLALSTL
ncbi:MAG: hypothetical protein AABN34_20925 [Acidobacteriota bacterium]